jgi:hypothetical protein
MSEKIPPKDTEGWSWRRAEYLSENKIQESNHLEYKRHLIYPGPDNAGDKSKEEWGREIEREFTAFANSSGGVILFGMSDDIEIKTIERPETEVEIAVNRHVNNTTPVLDPDISVLEEPSNPDRILVVAEVPEAKRKPVKTSDSAYYVRLDGEKHPMSRQQLQSMFVDADRRQQAVRQLEIEVSRFQSNYDQYIVNMPFRGEPPSLETVDEKSLKQAVLRNTHLYTNQDEDIKRILSEIPQILDRIAAVKGRYETGSENLGRVYFDRWADLNEHTQKRLKELSERLDSRFSELEGEGVIDPPVSYRIG